MKTPSQKRRLLFIYSLITLAFMAMGFRLFQFQIIDSDVITQESDKKLEREITQYATRGSIVDRNGAILAHTVVTYDLYVDKSKLLNQTLFLDELYKLYPNFDKGEAKAMLEDTSNNRKFGTVEFTLLFSGLTLEQRDVIRSLGRFATDDNNNPIYEQQFRESWVFKDEPVKVRGYSNNTMLAHVLGFVGKDHEGFDGIEYTFNEELKGSNGSILTQTDARGVKFADADIQVINEMVDGYTLVTTFDKNIQYALEEAIKAGYTATGATSVMAIVQHARTGDILAMGSYPTYYPGDFNTPIMEPYISDYAAAVEEYDRVLSEKDDALVEEKLSNMSRILSVMRKDINNEASYEPGSTFKLFTGAIGLEENVTHKEDSFYCTGYYIVDGEKKSCWKTTGHGDQTLEEAFENSCNVAFMQIIERMKTDKIYEYLAKLRLFEKSLEGQVSGENAPLLTDRDKVVKVDLASLSFGHNISITPVQVMKILTVFSNGGVLLEPNIIESIKTVDGEMIQDYGVRTYGQVLSKGTVDQVMDMLVSVVENGSGRGIAIPGYTIAGKTGTSVKKDEFGKYSNSKSVYASIAAIVPANDPVFNLLVVVDEPKTENVHGSAVAGPIAKKIIEETIAYLELEPNQSVDNVAFLVPNLIGLSLKEAQVLVKDLALSLTIINEELAIGENQNKAMIDKQYPPEGAVTIKGKSIEVIIKLDDQ